MAVLFLRDKVPSQASSQEPTSTLRRKHVHANRCWCTPNLAGASHGVYSASMYSCFPLVSPHSLRSGQALSVAKGLSRMAHEMLRCAQHDRTALCMKVISKEYLSPKDLKKRETTGEYGAQNHGGWQGPTGRNTRIGTNLGVVTYQPFPNCPLDML